MIYAKIINNTIAARDDSLDGFDLSATTADGFDAFDVPSVDWLQIDAGSIVIVDPVANYLLADAEAKKAEMSDAMVAALDAGFTCSNGITMDCHDPDVVKLDGGYRLALRKNETTMDIRDHGNVLHESIPIADVDAMIDEIGAHNRSVWKNKCLKQGQVDDVVGRTQLATSDPNYLTPSQARAEVQAITW